MSSTARSSVSMRNGYSTHSFLFAFHVKDLVFDRFITNNIKSDYLRLIWTLSNRGNETDPWSPTEDDETDQGSTYSSPPFQVSGSSATDVDTAFSLLRCRRVSGQKLTVKGGALTIRIALDSDTKRCLASSSLNFRALNVASAINTTRINFSDRRGLDVGYLELMYVSQQRWVKVNKRKLSFLNAERSTGVNSVVATSLQYATSALDGKEETTPQDQGSGMGHQFTPRLDDFVMLFWNSTNTCFVKQHPDDYQLQLMLNFVRAPMCRTTTTDSCINTTRSFEVDSNMGRSRTLSHYTESFHSGSRHGNSSEVLSFPNLRRALADNSGFTPTSEFTSEFGDYSEDYTHRSGFSLSQEPGSVRLYDYLSEQNRIIQSHLARQFTVDSMTSSSWTQISGDLSVTAAATPHCDSTFIPTVAKSVPLELPQSASKKQAISGYTPPNIPMGHSMTDRMVTRNVEVSASTDMVGLEKDAGFYSVGDSRDSCAKIVPQESLDEKSCAGTMRYGDEVVDATLECLLPESQLVKKSVLCMNSSLSTVDEMTICHSGNMPQSFNSFDWYKQEDVDMLNHDSLPLENERSHDRSHKCESLHETESHLDIVEDMNCSVVIETDTPTAISDDTIDLDRFYVEEYDFIGATGSMGSGCSSTINNFYTDDVDAGKRCIPPSPISSTHKGTKENLVSAVYNAITADITSLSVTDLGVDHVECTLDLMSEALHDARALQVQQERLSNDLLMNFFLQLLRCYSKKGVPQVMLMEEVIQRHFAAAELLHFLPTDYNPTVIRVSLDILVRQLGMSLPPGRPSETQQLGTDYVAPQTAVPLWGDTVRDDVVDRQTVDFFVPLSECDTYSEASEVDACFPPAQDDTRRQLALRQLQVLQDEMRVALNAVDPRKLVYISRLNSKPMKQRGCGLTLLAIKLALYGVLCGRRKIATENRQTVVV
ncbi:uncharacterized protein BXIN_2369 [Babesia sp. Xinjiang]|uniref:uncharacterized protein n=1 Tax=Babesia sp. Xinjiang TaxID=462227 RepID=UPI000A2265D5|nr:uncharacterized protein BXIN_2369 [Babesia sp. Xinjiang]ORM40730.1 hypothetical protein BXIN_2369 [Babesia sp. Xinjiang]